MKVMFMMLGLFAVVNSTQAVTVADVQIDDVVTLPETNAKLVLNGSGIRYKFFFKIYIAALYLAEKNDKPASIVTDPLPKRMMMYFLYDEVPAKKLVDAWNEGFSSNLSEQQFDRMKRRIEVFNAQFETMKEGDVVYLDYLPGEGTQVAINGQRKALIPGADFNAALLSVWLGESPADATLKQKLLGLE